MPSVNYAMVVLREFYEYIYTKGNFILTSTVVPEVCPSKVLLELKS